jgi:glycosyltransferase involved in cell wall biosynthesis
MTDRLPATAIVAARNEERHIAECVVSLLEQTWRPLEILVVDDGSTDRTAEIVRSFAAVRLLSQPHGGKARAVNAAAAVAQGDVLLFVDGDLVLDPDYVERLVAPIAAGECVGTAHATERVANPRNVWAACYQVRAGLPADRRLALSDAQLAEGSIVFRAIRASEFRRVGGFDDVGYLDDQTLFPKLGVRARWVSEAACAHYNAETLGEVFAMGVWGAHSIFVLHGSRALLSYLPLLSLLRAIRAAFRARRPCLAVYEAVYEAGVWSGLLRRLATGRFR